MNDIRFLTTFSFCCNVYSYKVTEFLCIHFYLSIFFFSFRFLFHFDTDRYTRFAPTFLSFVFVTFLLVKHEKLYNVFCLRPFLLPHLHRQQQKQKPFSPSLTPSLAHDSLTFHFFTDFLLLHHILL